MPVTIKLQGDATLIAKIGGMPSAVRAELTTTIRAMQLLFEHDLKVKHLSGPTGPHSLSVGQTTPTHTGGQLRRSVISLPIVSTGTSVKGVVSYGADVSYAAIHEFGGVINHPGGTPYLKSPVTGETVFISKEAASRMLFHVPVTAPHAIPIPERAPLRTTFAELKDTFVQNLQRAVQQGLRKT